MPRYGDAAFRQSFARICAHYFAHGAFLEDEQLLRNIDLLRGIPAVLVQGRLDMAGTPHTAWQLAKLWPDADLVLIPGGHGTGPFFKAATIQATDRFRP